eukprot:6406152-Amphidinium_carterae.1
MSADKMAVLKESLETLLQAKGMVSARLVYQAAGRATWLASIVPRCRPLVAQLWAAVADSF